MTTADKLREARDLISDPERWCQECYARDKNGAPVLYESLAAVRWCALGACEKVGADVRILWRAAERMKGFDPADINDSTNHPTVMKMFDLAIELAEKES